MILSTKIVLAVINYKILNEESLQNLESASLKRVDNYLNLLADNIGIEIDSLSVIEKCNSIMICISYRDEFSIKHVKNRILSAWDVVAYKSISDFISDISFYEDDNALKFLGECSVGIHSVTIGDSQVLAQMLNGLHEGISFSGNVLRIISEWIKNVSYECKLKTGIFIGNTSIERISSELIINNVSKDKEILIVGYGKSGQLVAKILAEESGYNIKVINRSEVNVGAHELNKGTVSYFSFNNVPSLNEVGGVVVAIDNNSETVKKVGNVINKITNKDVYYVDLSTPSVISGCVSSFCGISDISIIANNNVKSRASEVNKAKSIVFNNLKNVVELINKSIAKSYIDEQRKAKFERLDSDGIMLTSQRGEALRCIRDFLNNSGFLEVITPFIVGISTDPPKVDGGGTVNVDWIDGGVAFLRQSNQLYKQMLVASGIDKIYEIGPFWRKEEMDSYRHLRESIGLDIEVKEPKNIEYLYSLACEIIKYTNDCIVNKFGLSGGLIIPEIKEIPVISYSEAVGILRDSGNYISFGDDLGIIGESKIGQIIKKRSGYDIFVIVNYPDTIKKFYTKGKAEGLTETFDVIVGGWELVSGAIRQTDGEKMKKSMSLSNIDYSNYLFYISMIDKAPEHGGFCIGFDRLIAKILNKEMITDAVLFPRTSRKLIP